MRIVTRKRLGQLIRGSAVLLLLGLAAPVKAQEAVSLSAKVVRLTGPVRYTLNGTTWKELKVGEELKPGVIVQTAKQNSSVDIQWTQGGAATNSAGALELSANLVRLYENSALELRRLTATGTGADRAEQSELDLRAGQMLGIVKPLPTLSRYEVITPSGAAGVQPGVPESARTVFVLRAPGTLTVLSGTMLMAKADTEVHTQAVNADEQFDPATGQVTKLPQDAPERKLWHP